MPAEGETVLGNLLADSAASTYLLTLGLVLFLHLNEFLDIKSPMLHKPAVLGSQDGTNHSG
jgi:hypothetical protein